MKKHNLLRILFSLVLVTTLLLILPLIFERKVEAKETESRLDSSDVLDMSNSDSSF